MIQQGLVQLIQTNSGVAAICSAGGFFVQLPKDAALPTWTYAVVSDPVDYELTGPVDLRNTRFQIDCYGAQQADAILLAAAIDEVMSGYRGTLTDPDSTFVQGIFRRNSIDFFDEVSRTWRRMLEYQVCAVST